MAAEKPLKITKLPDMFVKTSADKSDCEISGITVLSETHLLLVDESNKTVKTVNILDKEIVSTYKPMVPPFDCAKFGEDKAIVTLPHWEKLQVFHTTDGELRESHYIPVLGRCQGIATTKDKMVVGFSTNHNEKVEILDLKGTVVLTIKHFVDNVPVIQCPYYVTIVQQADGTDVIFVSDAGTNSLFKLSFDGKIIQVFEKTFLAEGLTKFRQTDLLHCHWYDNKVEMLTPENNELVAVLDEDDGIKHPQAIAYSEFNDTVYVSGATTDGIQAFRLGEKV